MQFSVNAIIDETEILMFLQKKYITTNKVFSILDGISTRIVMYQNNQSEERLHQLIDLYCSFEKILPKNLNYSKHLSLFKYIKSKNLVKTDIYWQNESVINVLKDLPSLNEFVTFYKNLNLKDSSVLFLSKEDFEIANNRIDDIITGGKTVLEAEAFGLSYTNIEWDYRNDCNRVLYADNKNGYKIYIFINFFNNKSFDNIENASAYIRKFSETKK